MSYVKLLFLIIGQAIIVVLLGSILGSDFLLGLDFTSLVSLVGGIAVAIFFIEGLIVGFIGGCKLLPHYENLVSVDGGENWIEVYRGIFPSPKRIKKIRKKAEEITENDKARKGTG